MFARFDDLLKNELEPRFLLIFKFKDVDVYKKNLWRVLVMTLSNCLKIMKLQLLLKLKFDNTEAYKRFMEGLENERSK